MFLIYVQNIVCKIIFLCSISNILGTIPPKNAEISLIKLVKLLIKKDLKIASI